MELDLLIDPGHGGTDPGAIGPGGSYEKNINLAITLKVVEFLSFAGLRVGITRGRDEYLSNAARADLAARWRAKRFLSIHVNASIKPGANGGEVHCLARGGEGEKMALALQAQIKGLGLSDRGVKVSNFHVLRETKCPAALAEIGFISNPVQEALLNTEDFQTRAALAISRGYLNYLGLPTISFSIPPGSRTVQVDLMGRPYYGYINSDGIAVGPIRALFEGAGFKVDYSAELNKVIISRKA